MGIIRKTIQKIAGKKQAHDKAVIERAKRIAQIRRQRMRQKKALDAFWEKHRKETGEQT